MTITIDEEFQSLIPPLTDFERLQLGETLEKEGCRDPLITWNGILIDGHNRHEICERLGLEYTTREIVLSDRDSVKQWMYRNQLGRRNLSPVDASELRGLMYNARKKTKGGDRKSKVQNDPLIESTAEVVAKETGVSAATIKRDGEYAEAVDEVAKTDPAIRSKVRKGDVKKKDVIAAAKAKAAPDKPVATVKPVAAKPAEPEVEKKSPSVIEIQRTLIKMGRDKKRHPQLIQIAGEAVHRMPVEHRIEFLASTVVWLGEDEQRLLRDAVREKQDALDAEAAEAESQPQ